MAMRNTPTAADNTPSRQASRQAETQDTQESPSPLLLPPPRPQITHNMSTPSSFHAIQSLLTPFNTLFNTILSSLRHPLITHIDLTLPAKHSPLPYPIYTFHANPLTSARGATAFPASTPTHLHRAFHKLDLCDLSVHIMQPHMQRVLNGVGARASWTIVCAVPRYIVRYASEEEAGLSFHSVCMVRTRGGEEFGVDFTIEQFGYPAGMWFMPWGEYCDVVCEDGGRLADEEWVVYTEKMAQEDNLYVLTHALNEACGCVGDEVFRGLEVGEREGYVEKCALEAVEVWDVDE